MDSVNTKKSILETLQMNQKKLEDFGVNEIGLFGSYLRNEATEKSDIDLLVNISREKKTFRNFMSLSYFLEELFNRKVELVTKQSLSPYIGPHILNSVEYVAFTSWVIKTHTSWKDTVAKDIPFVKEWIKQIIKSNNPE